MEVTPSSSLNNKKWKFIFYNADVQGPILLGLSALEQMDVFSRHPMVSIETVDLYSTQTGLAS